MAKLIFSGLVLLIITTICSALPAHVSGPNPGDHMSLTTVMAQPSQTYVQAIALETAPATLTSDATASTSSSAPAITVPASRRMLVVPLAAHNWPTIFGHGPVVPASGLPFRPEHSVAARDDATTALDSRQLLAPLPSFHQEEIKAPHAWPKMGGHGPVVPAGGLPFQPDGLAARDVTASSASRVWPSVFGHGPVVPASGLPFRPEHYVAAVRDGDAASSDDVEPEKRAAYDPIGDISVVWPGLKKGAPTVTQMLTVTKYPVVETTTEVAYQIVTLTANANGNGAPVATVTATATVIAEG